jgi:hypothetical protein
MSAETFFQTKYRPIVTDGQSDSEPFVTLSDDCPEWFHQAVMEAHGVELPNDWVYAMCRAIVAELEGFDADADVYDVANDVADALLPIYNADRVAWLAENIGRSSWGDDAKSLGLTQEPSDIFGDLGTGIYCQLRFITETLFAAIQENAEAQ